MADQEGQQGTGPGKGDEIAPPRLVTQFVIFPLAIVAVGVIIYLFLGILTTEDRTAKDYLDTIKTGGLNSRWQAAYELVKVLAVEQREGTIDPEFAREIVRVFEASKHDDPRVRRYLARAMEMVEDPTVVEALIAALEDPDEETRLYAIASLGGQKAEAAVDPLIDMADSPDAGFRKAVVYALGQIGSPRGIPVLERRLQDSAPDVRWNAALQLAANGRDTGKRVLAEMLNRSFLESVEGMTEDQRQAVMVYAVRAVGALDAREFKETLEGLKASDPDLKVRQAAIEVLERWD